MNRGLKFASELFQEKGRDKEYRERSRHVKNGFVEDGKNTFSLANIGVGPTSARGGRLRDRDRAERCEDREKVKPSADPLEKEKEKEKPPQLGTEPLVVGSLGSVLGPVPDTKGLSVSTTPVSSTPLVQGSGQDGQGLVRSTDEIAEMVKGYLMDCENRYSRQRTELVDMFAAAAKDLRGEISSLGSQSLGGPELMSALKGEIKNMSAETNSNLYHSNSRLSADMDYLKSRFASITPDRLESRQTGFGGYVPSNEYHTQGLQGFGGVQSKQRPSIDERSPVVTRQVSEVKKETVVKEKSEAKGRYAQVVPSVFEKLKATYPEIGDDMLGMIYIRGGDFYAKTRAGYVKVDDSSIAKILKKKH